jgi:hypothetical protein
MPLDRHFAAQGVLVDAERMLLMRAAALILALALAALMICASIAHAESAHPTALVSAPAYTGSF